MESIGFLDPSLLLLVLLCSSGILLLLLLLECVNIVAQGLVNQGMVRRRHPFLLLLGLTLQTLMVFGSLLESCPQVCSQVPGSMFGPSLPLLCPIIKRPKAKDPLHPRLLLVCLQLL